MASISKNGFEADMRQLDVGIRQLKVQYDMFFAGALDYEPSELRERLRRIIRRYSADPPRAYAQQFLFQSLVARFNCMSELWAKTMRAREEGDQRTRSMAERFGIKERLLTRCVVTDPSKADGSLKRLHARFVEASRRHGQPEVPFDKFIRGLGAQTRKLRRSGDCDQIELRLVERDDGVQVKARPGRSRAAGSSQ